MRILKKILKIARIVFAVLFVALYIFFYTMTSPKSDKKVLKAFEEKGVIANLTHKKSISINYN